MSCPPVLLSHWRTNGDVSEVRTPPASMNRTLHRLRPVIRNLCRNTVHFYTTRCWLKLGKSSPPFVATLPTTGSLDSLIDLRLSLIPPVFESPSVMADNPYGNNAPANAGAGGAAAAAGAAQPPPAHPPAQCTVPPAAQAQWAPPGAPAVPALSRRYREYYGDASKDPYSQQYAGISNEFNAPVNAASLFAPAALADRVRQECAKPLCETCPWRW
jgi:hypothetical protein